MTDGNRYSFHVARALAWGRWLVSPAGLALSAERWERAFAAYQEDLAEVRRLGEELRPVPLRETSPDSLTEEVRRVFE